MHSYSKLSKTSSSSSHTVLGGRSKKRASESLSADRSVSTSDILEAYIGYKPTNQSTFLLLCARLDSIHKSADLGELLLGPKELIPDAVMQIVKQGVADSSDVVSDRTLDDLVVRHSKETRVVPLNQMVFNVLNNQGATLDELTQRVTGTKNYFLASTVEKCASNISDEIERLKEGGRMPTSKKEQDRYLFLEQVLMVLWKARVTSAQPLIRSVSDLVSYSARCADMFSTSPFRSFFKCVLEENEAELVTMYEDETLTDSRTRKVFEVAIPTIKNDLERASNLNVGVFLKSVLEHCRVDENLNPKLSDVLANPEVMLKFNLLLPPELMNAGFAEEENFWMGLVKDLNLFQLFLEALTTDAFVPSICESFKNFCLSCLQEASAVRSFTINCETVAAFTRFPRSLIQHVPDLRGIMEKSGTFEADRDCEYSETWDLPDSLKWFGIGCQIIQHIRNKKYSKGAALMGLVTKAVSVQTLIKPRDNLVQYIEDSFRKAFADEIHAFSDLGVKECKALNKKLESKGFKTLAPRCHSRMLDIIFQKQMG